MIERVPIYAGVPYEEFIQKEISVFTSLIPLPESLNEGQFGLCYATLSFFGKCRYDDVQVSEDDGSKYFGKLLTLFTFQDLYSNTHSVCFLQEYDLVNKNVLPFNLPSLQLQTKYQIIPADAVDQMVEMKPDREICDLFYVNVEIKQY